MWKTKSEPGYYTVYPCPQCRTQRTWHTLAYDLWRCDMCGLKMKYNGKDDKLHLV
jgi:ribosomal protein L37AE/L43A